MTVREFLGHVILLCVLLCVMFPGVWLRGEALAPGDVVYAYPPWTEVRPAELEIENPWWTIEAITAINKFYWLANRAFDAGEWPLWNDLEMGGMPLLANGQSAVFYPPRLLHRAFDLFVASTLYIQLKLLLCGITACICARVMGLSLAAARIVSVGWMLCGYNVLWCYWPLPDVSAWLPLELAAVELLLQRRYRKGFFCLAIAATLLMLAGHPETAFTGSLWIGAYFCLRLAWGRLQGEAVVKPLTLAGAAWGVGLLASAAQTLPTLEYLANTSRVESSEWSAGLRYMSWDSLHGFWLPNYTNMPDGPPITILWVAWLFVGLTVWLGLTTGAIRAIANRKVTPRVACLIVGATLALFFSVSNPLTDRLLLPPGIASMWQRYHIAFALLAILILGATGIDAWLKSTRSKRETRALLVCVGLVFIAALANYLSTRPLLIVADTHGAIVRQLAFAGAAVAAGTILLTMPAFRNRSRWAGWGLVVVLAVELWVNMGRFHHSVPRDQFFPDTALTRFLQEQPKPMRVHTTAIIPGLLPFYGIEMMRGYDGLYPRHAIWNLAKADAPKSMRRALGITHFLENPNDDRLREGSPIDAHERERLAAFGEMDTLEVYRVTDSLPRAHLVPALEVVADETAMTARLDEPGFDPGRTTVTLDAVDEIVAPENAFSGTATIVHHSSTRVRVDVNPNSPAVLVLSDSFYPGWRAYRDESLVQLLRLNGSMRGVVLPAGACTIEFRYEPLSFTIGIRTSVAALFAGLCASLFFLSRMYRGD